LEVYLWLEGHFLALEHHDLPLAESLLLLVGHLKTKTTLVSS
jgi:hypothetical protein